MESKLKEFEGGGGGGMFGKSRAHMTTTSFPEFSQKKIEQAGMERAQVRIFNLSIN